MKKKKLVTIVLSAIMVLALAACESNDTSAESTSAQITSEPITVASTQRDEAAATPTTTASPTTKPEVTEAPTETSVATEAPTESPDPTQAPTEIPDATEAPTEQPQATEQPTEQQQPVEQQQPTEQPTEQQQPVEQQQPTEQPTEQQQPTTSSIDAYIHDGTFSVLEYSNAIACGELYSSDGDVCFVFPTHDWFVQTGHLSPSHPNQSYIIVGVWDESGSSRSNFPTYVWTCNTGDTIATDYAGNLSVEALSHLVDTVNAMLATNNPNAAPSVSGITFSYDPNFDCP